MSLYRNPLVDEAAFRRQYTEIHNISDYEVTEISEPDLSKSSAAIQFNASSQNPGAKGDSSTIPIVASQVFSGLCSYLIYEYNRG